MSKTKMDIYDTTSRLRATRRLVQDVRKRNCGLGGEGVEWVGREREKFGWMFSFGSTWKIVCDYEDTITYSLADAFLNPVALLFLTLLHLHVTTTAEHAFCFFTRSLGVCVGVHFEAPSREVCAGAGRIALLLMGKELVEKSLVIGYNIVDCFFGRC
jgi:hypothetical protein